MDDHLSWLIVDEVSAGIRTAPEHVVGCGQCQSRIREATAARKRVLESPAFAQRVRALQTTPDQDGPEAPNLRATWLSWAVPAGLAAAVLVLAFVNPAPVGRLKGGAILEVRDVRTGESVTRVHSGNRVALALGGGGHSVGLVFTVDAHGTVSQIWPASGNGDGVSRGNATPVSPEFAITPGDITLFAFFSDAPLAPALARTRIEAAISQSLGTGESPLDVSPPALDGERARARLRLMVAPGEP